jgi:hypothetical protein
MERAITMKVKAYTLELSGDQHLRLVSTIETAIFAGRAEINDQLQQEPWVGFGWSVEDLLADPEQKPTRTMTIWAATCCNWLRPSRMPMPETFRARTKLVEK